MRRLLHRNLLLGIKRPLQVCFVLFGRIVCALNGGIVGEIQIVNAVLNARQRRVAGHERLLQFRLPCFEGHQFAMVHLVVAAV